MNQEIFSRSLAGQPRAEASPMLLRSSADIGWDGIEVRIFDEPHHLEQWLEPAVTDIVLVLVTHGVMRHEIRQSNSAWRALLIRQGDMFLNPGSGPLESRWQSLSAAPLRTMRIRLASEILSHTADELGDSHSASLKVWSRAGFQDPFLFQMGRVLAWELEQRPPAGALYSQTVARMLALHLLRHYTTARIEPPAPSKGFTLRQVEQLRAYICAHLNQKLSLETLAQHTGFSVYHFARVFQQTTGESPHQFVVRHRMEHAQYLLHHTNKPLAHVAESCGFSDQSHLTRLFKRHLNVTPRAFRRDLSLSADQPSH
ncbi:MAG: helix-turn-helix transcriptional regulator [Ktedonobacterales bacterium]|nr:helix-turn-helix transcriptional regulator [Ktedonobacterales bacterium]